MENDQKEKYDREKHCGFSQPVWGLEDLPEAGSEDGKD